MTTLTDHKFLVRINAEDGEVIFEDADFSKDARFDWFDQVCKEVAEPGETIRLIDVSNGRVIVEEIRK